MDNHDKQVRLDTAGAGDRAPDLRVTSIEPEPANKRPGFPFMAPAPLVVTIDRRPDPDGILRVRA